MAGDDLELKLDPARMKEKEKWAGTGIFIRAADEAEKHHTEDIALLDAESLLAWLRSQGGHNPRAEDVVGVLLGHGHIVKEETTDDAGAAG